MATTTTARDVALAQFAETAYLDAPPALPAGFAAVPNESLGVVIDAPGESYAGGVYHNGAGEALVASGLLDGQQTLVLAFRGSDERADSINSLRDPNAAYPDFAELVAAVD